MFVLLSLDRYICRHSIRHWYVLLAIVMLEHRSLQYNIHYKKTIKTNISYVYYLQQDSRQQFNTQCH
jgi:hypothetical protein